MKNITTIEGLAALINETMASKEDIQGLATKEDVQELRTEMNEQFEKVDARLDHLNARMGRLEAGCAREVLTS
jgi:hypothetical protein